MNKIQPAAVKQYLDSLPDDRRKIVAALRKLIRRNLPKGYQETIDYGIISYSIPLKHYPDAYNGKPLCYLGLSSHKNHLALYLMSVYGDPRRAAWLKEEFRKAGKRFDMGKSCLRFRKLEDLPLEAIAMVVASMTPEEYIARYEEATKKR